MSMVLIMRIDTMGKHMRDLTVGPFSDEEWVYFTLTPQLGSILRSTDALHSLTWQTHRVIRPDVLGLFHELHPSAKLNVVLRDRTVTPLSATLLSSPQLHSLDMEILCTKANKVSGQSEAAFIKEHVFHNKSKLWSLCLDFLSVDTPKEQPQFLQWSYLRRSYLNLDWQDSNVSPALEELIIEYDFYHLSLENCGMWAKVTSWHQVRKLDLGWGSPRYFFASLANHTPNLKSLRFWINVPRTSTWDLHPLDVGMPILVGFITLVPALRVVEFGAHVLKEFTIALSRVVENCKGSLRRLAVQCCEWGMTAWQPQNYVDLLAQSPGLGYLKAQIKEDIVEGVWVGVERYFDPWTKYVSINKDIRQIPAGRPRQRCQRVQKLNLR